MLHGPATPTNIDVDVIANYQIILDRVSKLDANRSTMANAIEATINSEEFGRDSVTGDEGYVISRFADREGEKQFGI